MFNICLLLTSFALNFYFGIRSSWAVLLWHIIIRFRQCQGSYRSNVAYRDNYPFIMQYIVYITRNMMQLKNGRIKLTKNIKQPKIINPQIYIYILNIVYI